MVIRAHVLENNIVTNTIMVDSLDELPNLIDATEGSIGWVFDGKKLYDPNAPTQQELELTAWEGIRADRNARLAICDWTQLPDAPLTNVQTSEWATYRQALRDITETADPFAVVWPDAPQA
jgi:hypothetical protein